ncbi:hypothetical protein ABPG72_008520 [Tetrahymena utriculariae]
MRNTLVFFTALSLIFATTLEARSYKKKGDEQTSAITAQENNTTDSASQDQLEENNIQDNIGQARQEGTKAVGDIFGNIGDSVGNLGQAGNNLGKGMNNVADNLGQTTNSLGQAIQDQVDEAQSYLDGQKDQDQNDKTQSILDGQTHQDQDEARIKSKKFIAQKILGKAESKNEN